MKESNFHSMIQVNQTTQTKENTMNELSNLHNSDNHNRTMSSREIAELTGKLHKNVLADIRQIIETLSGTKEINRLKFQPVEYTDAKGEKRPEYLLDFEATMLVVSGYDAVLRARIIHRWKELETGEAKPISQPPALPPLKEEIATRSLEALHRAAAIFGYEGNQALLCADKGVRKLHGISLMTLLEIELKSPDNEALLIATEIGKRLNPPISAKSVNLLLADMKLQERVEYRAGKFEWRLTDRGKAYGSYLDTGKVHSNGTPIQQIKWKESILPLVQKHSDSL